MRHSGIRDRSGTPAALVRSPVPGRPHIHQILLPLDGPPEGSGAAPPLHVQVYLIDRQPLTLVDTGIRSPASRAVLEGALEQLGHGLADIQRVVVTHAHRDHMGLVQTIRDAGADLECLVHEADAAVVEHFEADVRLRVNEMTLLFRENGVPEEILAPMHAERVEALRVDDAEGQSTRVDRVLRDGDRIEGKDSGFVVRHSPGHTPGHILLEDAEIGLFLTGDQIMGQAVPNTENFYQGTLPEPNDPLRRRRRFRGLVELRRSLRRLLGGPNKIFLPGYGGIITRTDRAIRDTLLYYDVRLQRIERGLRHMAPMGQEVTAYEILKALFPANESFQDMRSHLLLVIGALDCLEDDGKLVCQRRSDGVLTHRHR